MTARGQEGHLQSCFRTLKEEPPLGGGGRLRRDAQARLAILMTVTALWAGCGGGGTQSTPQTAAQPSVTASPSSLTFAGQTMGTSSAAQTVTLQNAGAVAYAITGVVAGGDFSQTNNCPASLAPNSSCSIQVIFTPTAMGTRTGILSVSTAGTALPLSINLTGTSGSPLAQLSTLSLTFANQNVGSTSAAQTLTLSNTGIGALIISSLTVTGDFAQTNNCGTSVAVGGNCTFSVTFTPTAGGTRTGSMLISDNSSGGPQTIGLTGTGVGPVAQLSTPSLTFANQSVGSAGPAQIVTLTNTGNVVLNITSIVASGDFAAPNNCGSSLSGGGSCAINVTFTPTSNGTRTGSLTITDNSYNSPQTVALSGESIQAIALNLHQISLVIGQTVQFQIAFIDEASGAVTWSVDGTAGGNSSVGTISSSGLYTSPSTVGQHTVQATMGSQSDSAQVYVTNLPGGVLTQRYDNSRIGLNAQETVLTPANVNQNQFGKLFSLPVDGQVYAEPLYMQNVSINGAVHNVLFVATEHDSVYAFDADGQSTTPLWHTSFLNPLTGVTTVPSQDVGAPDITPEIGITSTPVIDPSGGTIYLTAKTKELQVPSCTSNCNYNYVHRLHALDITTGAEKLGGPVMISASVPGSGYDNVNGTVTFGALRQLQRPALLLLNGVVYIGFGSHGDVDPYHGWLMAYNATNLQQIAVFNVTPNGARGALWQGGGGFSVDPQGNLFLVTANGTFDANATGGVDYGDSAVKLQLNSSQFQVLDYFAPDNEATMEAEDLDLGSDPGLVLPDQPGPYPHLLATAGKDGRLWILNRDNLGHLQKQDAGAVQVIQGFNGMLFAGGAYWNGNLYFQAVTDYLKEFPLQSGMAQSPTLAGSLIGYPGAPAVVSANGTSDGIGWMVQADAFGSGGPAVLHAFDATNVATELYNSAQALNFRDQAGPAVKFVVPTVANGKVYIGTGSEVDVYGLLP